MNTVDNLKRCIATRIRAARVMLQMTQKDLVEASGIPLPSLKNYEGAKQIPGGEAIAALVKVGVNSNWLLTGDGPMLLKDINTGGDIYYVEEPESRLHPAKPVPMKINRGALAALLRGAIAITAQGMSVENAADMAAEMYERALESGEITPEGVGKGNLGRAA